LLGQLEEERGFGLDVRGVWEIRDRWERVLAKRDGSCILMVDLCGF